MAGKKNTEKEGSSWIGKVEDYSRKIWLAGLGVYSKIDTDGSKLFDTLVKDGEKAEKLTKNAVGKYRVGRTTRGNAPTFHREDKIGSRIEQHKVVRNH